MEQMAFISVIYQTEINPQTYACKYDLRLLKKKICICCVLDHYFLIGIYKMKTTEGGEKKHYFDIWKERNMNDRVEIFNFHFMSFSYVCSNKLFF